MQCYGIQTSCSNSRNSKVKLRLCSYCYIHALNLSPFKACFCVKFETLWVFRRLLYFSSLAHQKRITYWNKIYLINFIPPVYHAWWKALYYSRFQIQISIFDIMISLNNFEVWREIESSSMVRSYSLAIGNCFFIVAHQCISYIFAVTMPLNKLLKRNN